MPEPLKNLLNSELLHKITLSFKKHDASFQGDQFKKLVFNDNWDQLELKERIRHITKCLHKVNTSSFKEKMTLFKKVIKEGEEDQLGLLFFPDYVEVYGLEELEASLDALEAFTQYASGELAIRPFIKKYEEGTMNRMNDWAENDNFHLRRLASEGCRPRLPWAMALPKFKKDPSPVLPILEQLKSDPTDYVRRSVANNLNDISKDHPDLVIEIGKKWKGQSKETDWVVKHAFRTLLKKGHTQALVLFGFSAPDQIRVENLAFESSSIKIGDTQNFQFEVINENKAPSLLRLEYGVDYVKKNGKTSRKIFQITEKTFTVGQHLIQKKQSFQNFSTRIHYPGSHQISILVNGVEKASLSFELRS